MIQKIAIILNVILLIIAIVLGITEGFPSITDWEGLVALAVFFVLPIINIIALFVGRNKESWLSLFLKRKAMEEKKKIEELK